MKKYFIHELKRNTFALCFLTLIAVLIYTFPLLIEHSDSLRLNVNLSVISTIGGALALIVPLKIFEYKMKKRSVDLFYSLPLSHTNILIVKYFVGLVIVFVPYTVAYWLGSFVVMGKVFKFIDAVWYVPQFLGSIIPVFMIYALSAFIFTRANNRQDGGIFVIFWLFAIPLVMHVLCDLINVTSYSGLTLIYTPLSLITEFTSVKITGYVINYTAMNDAQIAVMIVGFVLNSLLTIVSTIGIVVLEKQSKAENVGQTSESVFGYKVMLPLYTVCVLALCTMSGYFISLTIFAYLMIAIAMFALTILYRRTAKIGKKQAIIFVVSVAAGIILAIINSFAY